MDRSESEEAPDPGFSVEGYEDLEEFSRTRHSVVYRARQAGTEDRVAIKVPRRRLDRFERERQIMEDLALSCVPELVEYRAGEEPYLVLEWLEGEPLEDWCHNRKPSLREVLRLGIRIGGALAELHAAGIVHRDLSPNNILLLEDGGIAILDFGLARRNPGPEQVPLTDSEVGLPGTLGFSAPEQVLSGSRATERSDVYSLGALLCWMLTGRTKDYDRSKLPRPKDRKALPRAVRSFLETLCARKPMHRPRSVVEAVDRLRELAENPHDAGLVKLAFLFALLGILAVMAVVHFGVGVLAEKDRDGGVKKDENVWGPTPGRRLASKKQFEPDELLRSPWWILSEDGDRRHEPVKRDGAAALRMGGGTHFESCRHVLAQPVVEPEAIEVKADIWLTDAGAHYTDVKLGLIRRRPFEMELPATQTDWASIPRLPISVGTRLRIEASGEILGAKGGKARGPWSPEGRRGVLPPDSVPVKGQPEMSLLARIGKGRPRFVGTGTEWVAGTAGPLQLRINDGNGADNEGAFRVRIRSASDGLLWREQEWLALFWFQKGEDEHAIKCRIRTGTDREARLKFDRPGAYEPRRWHRARLRIDATRRVHFFLNGEKIWTTPEPLPETFQAAHLAIGGTSGEGPAYIRNLEIHPAANQEQ